MARSHSQLLANGVGIGWQTAGDKETIVHAFSKFSPGVKHIVNSATNNLKVWELYDMKTLPTWVKGNAALLGDAAHPLQPCKKRSSVHRVGTILTSNF